MNNKYMALLMFLLTFATAGAQNNVSFTASATSGCAPLAVTLTNTSSIGNYYRWDISNAPVQYGVNSSYTFAKPGSYQVHLTAYDTTGGNMTYLGEASTGINVMGPNMELSADMVCPGETVRFYIWPGPLSVNWDFGDGSFGNMNQEEHVYNAPGAYTVKATVNTSNCGTVTLTDTIIVTSSSTPSAYFRVKNDAVCPGDPLTLNPKNPYLNTYFWNFGDGFTTTDPSPTYSYATPGTYPVSLTVTNSCGGSNTYTDTITVSTSAQLPTWGMYINANPSAPCPGQQVFFNSEFVAQTMIWSFGDGDSSFAVSPVHVYDSAGTFTVSLRYINGCGDDTVVSKTINVGISNAFNQPFMYDIMPKAACPGDDVRFHSSGDFTSATWTFGDGSTSADPKTMHAYSSTGAYPVTLTLVDFCGNDTIIMDTITISNSIVPDLTSEMFGTPTSSACPGDSVLFYSSGASAYSWNFGDGTTSSQTTELVVPGEGVYDIIKHAYTALGTYTVSLTYTNGCGNSDTDSLTITIGNSEPVNGNIEQVSGANACEPVQFASIGGASTTWYFGDGDSLTTSDIFIQHIYTSPGSYVVVGVLKNGCGNSFTDTLFVQVKGMSLSAVVANVSCNGGANGAIDLSVMNGVAPYAVSWSNGGSMMDLTGITAGSYTVMVTDTNGCVVDSTFTVGQPPVFSVTASSTNATCGSADGTASAVASGGTPGYSYSWSSGSIASTASGLAAGTYGVVVTDANGCTVSGNVSVQNAGAPSVSLSSVSATCPGSCTGSISTTVSGGTPGYSYSWSGGLSGGGNISGVCSGIYTVTVTDAAGCKAIQSTTVAEPGPLSANASVTDVKCFGGSNGSIALSPTGGTAPYQLSIFPGGNNTNLAAGTYTITITDFNGCSNSETATVGESADILVSTMQSNLTCYGDSSGSAMVHVMGGAGDYSYQWSTGDTIDITNGLAAGTYNVIVTDGNGCKDSASVTITEPAPVVPTITISGNTLTSSPAASYQWFLNGTAITNETGQTYVAVADGMYSVAVTDNSGCTGVSDEVQVILVSVSGHHKNSVRIFPVPANDVLFVDGMDGASIELRDLQGRLIAASVITGGKTSFSTALVSSGIYQVVVHSAGDAATYKVAVTH